MSAQFSPVGPVIAAGVFSLSLMVGALAFAGGAAAQTAIVPAGAPANLSPHDAAVDATRRGDYIAALAFAKQAAAAGQPLDADQMDYITGKAAKQQAIADADAQVKARSVAASATAQQILDRQQKDYAARERKAREAAAKGQPSAAEVGQETETVRGVTGVRP